jgi:hypothetical protein
LQALTLLNDPSFVEAARALAERIIREGGDSTSARIDWAYRQVLGSAPDDEIAAILSTLFEKHHEHYRQNKGAAEQIIGVGSRPAAKDVDRAELAGWTSIARVLLNLHETITRY